jgi:hypothetical protein
MLMTQLGYKQDLLSAWFALHAPVGIPEKVAERRNLFSPLTYCGSYLWKYQQAKNVNFFILT